jgi:predicted ribosomally synthesized peptide with nif11-like leader
MRFAKTKQTKNLNQVVIITIYKPKGANKMSVENAKNFYAKLETDETLSQQLEQAGSEADGWSTMVSVAQTNGFDFSQADAEAYLSQVAGAGDQSAPLSDAQLDSVAGGGFTTNNTAICNITKRISTVTTKCSISLTI